MQKVSKHSCFTSSSGKGETRLHEIERHLKDWGKFLDIEGEFD